jgi:uncharacterized protein (TIGR02246 family)
MPTTNQQRGVTTVTVAEQTLIEERLDRLESTDAIQRLMADYALGFDRHDRERFMHVFHEGAVYNIPGDFGKSSGTSEIEAALCEIWKACPGTHHWITNVTVEFAGPDTAAGDAHVITYVRTSAGGEGFVHADYDNLYGRRNGLWRATSISLDVPWWKQVTFGSLLEQ